MFDDLETFYIGDPRRRPGMEYDYGHYWRDANLPGTFRVTWNEGTGEVYAIQQGEVSVASVPGGVAIAAGRASGSVEILGVVAPIPADEETTEWRGDRHVSNVVLAGWAVQADVKWVRERVARARELLGQRFVARWTGDAAEDRGWMRLANELDKRSGDLAALGCGRWDLSSLGVVLHVPLDDDDGAAAAALVLIEDAIAASGIGEPDWRRVPPLP